MCAYRRATKPLDIKAVKDANAAVASETGGRRLTMGPEDGELRKKWMDAYVDAGGEYKEVRPSGKKPKDAKVGCRKKLIRVEWNPKDAYCGDPVLLCGTAENFDPDTPANAKITASGKGKVADLKGTGQNTFNLPWEVKDVVFKGEGMPKKFKLKGKLSAAGQTADTREALEIHRVPDKAPEAVTFHLTSAPFITFDPAQDGGNTGRATVKQDGADWKYYDSITNSWTVLPRDIGSYAQDSYEWDAKFKVGIDKGNLKITLGLQLEKAWLGKWVSFDPAAPPAGDGMGGWAFVKRIGGAWRYWNTTTNAWTALPRNIASYTVNDIIFVKQGANFVGRDDATQTWPEAFPAPANFNQKKNDWLNSIHTVWDNKFNLHRKQCKSSSKKCCRWRIRVKAEWSHGAGDKVVYAVWEQGNLGRSSARDWYLRDARNEMAAHETGHLLGAFDEYPPDGALDAASPIIEDDSIMGMNLTKAYDRHLNNVRDKSKEKINQLIGRAWDFEIKDV